MRVLASLFAFLVLGGSASAQILKIELKDPKKAKALKNFCIEINDELFLVGEAKTNIEYHEDQHSFGHAENKNCELWVPDMDNPRACPYKVVKGEKVKTGGKSTVSFPGADVKDIQFLIQDQSLFGLAKEYGRREDEVDDLRKERDACKRGTAEWKTKQSSLIQTLERMRSWLDQTLYSRAAKKVAKEIDAEEKAAKDAMAHRLEDAKASIKMVPPPEDLVRIGKEIYGDAVTFHVQESTHIRIIYREENGDERVKGLMELGENLIDGFRVQFIDPYVKDDYKDYLPDQLFSEFCFAPDDPAQYEQFMKKYYGVALNEHQVQWLKEKKISGTPFRKGKIYVRPAATAEQSDLEGDVAHGMGHNLANIHYNQDRANDPADWIYEGVANWISLEYLGRNSVRCVNFDTGKYARKGRGDNADGENSLLTGTADIYHRLAIEEGATIDALAIKGLAEFGDPDVAKSFSLFNFIAKTQGEKGQRWLRACCNSAAAKDKFIPTWRAKSEELYEVKGEDVFKKLDAEWKRFAEEQVGIISKN